MNTEEIRVFIENNKSQMYKTFGEVFNKEVPSQGSAPTMYGELIRAVSRIGGRWMNDGDMFFRDYGIETAGNAACWILEHGTNEMQVHIRHASTFDNNDEDYQLMVDELVYLALNLPEEKKIEMQNTVAIDFQSGSYNQMAIDKWGDSYEYDDE